MWRCRKGRTFQKGSTRTRQMTDIDWTMLAKRRFLSPSVAVLAAAFCLLANASAQLATPETFLPGSHVKLEKAVEGTDVIVIGTLETLGKTSLLAPGMRSYHGAKLHVEKVLKGPAAQGNMGVYIFVHCLKGHIEENDPEVGKRYLFFIDDHTHRNDHFVLKIMEPDDGNIAATSTAIEAAFESLPKEKMQAKPPMDGRSRVRWIPAP